MTKTPGDSTTFGAACVGPSGDPEHPIAVRVVADGPTEHLTRDDAWRLWHQLQAELVRTMPYPPSYPTTRITP